MTDNVRFLPLVPAPPDSAEQPARAMVEWPAVAERMRQYAAVRGQQSAAERCELCGAEIASEHGHLVNIPTRSLLCVCRPCYLLFAHDGSGGARFRAVPRRYRVLRGFGAAIEHWELLQIPIGLAFFFCNGATGRTTAFYPSPAGATESELPLETWDGLVGAVPDLATLASDVEALLVRRPPSTLGGSSRAGAQPPAGVGDERAAATDALIVPIDACYELVGRIRRSWRGFQGGDEVWREIDEFFARAAERAATDADDRGAVSGDRSVVTP